MLNNKGFAVSTILYTLLIAFLMFLGVTLAMFSSSINIIGNANIDLINNTAFRAIQVKDVSPGCGSSYQWYQKVDKTNSNTIVTSDTIVRINSRYGTGTMYWPKDFPGNSLSVIGSNVNITATGSNGNISVRYDESQNNDPSNGLYGTLTFTDNKGTNQTNDDETKTVIISNICQ